MLKTRSEEIIDCFGGVDDLVFWSFRYFLGRMTIAACCFAQDLAKAWELLDARARAQIEKELEEAFNRDDEARKDKTRAICACYPLGMDCDRAAWELVRKAYKGGGKQND